MTNLLEKALETKNLRKAWNEVDENQGMPGVDQVSLRAWQRNWEERLVNLARSVRANTYRPHRLRSRRIPKNGRRGYRTLRIPTVTDRVLQQAVLEVLYPVFEPRFLDFNFGYRPGRRLADAVERILVLRENGWRRVLDADIDDFFNQVACDLLETFLRADLPDDSLLPLIHAWVETGLSDPERARGIPLGSPLSPLLANIYLHRLDTGLDEQGWPVVRYADDFVVFARSREQVEQAYQDVEQVLAGLRLRYEPSKTRLTSFEDGFDFIGVHFESSVYRYTHLDKQVEVRGTRPDLLFNRYGPDYG